jgi:dTDP-glucose pyrophosphorylase
MSDPVRKAVLLAAGRGTRMGSITREVPKPMLPLHGKPLLEHIIERMKSVGIERFLIVTGYHRESIERHFGNRPGIELAVQEPVNGTATAAMLARDFVEDQPFLLSYGDILCDSSEYERMQRSFEKKPAAAAIVAVKEVDDPWQGAAVYEIGGQIIRIIEKPPQGTSVTRWNSAGFYLFKPLLFDYLRRVEPSTRGEYELTSALSLMLSDRLELYISIVAGEWRDVGRPEDLEAVRQST